MPRHQIHACLLILLALLAGFFVATVTWATTASPTVTLRVAQPADPHRVLGNDSCVKCHAGEQEVWSRTPHSQTFEELHRHPEAKAISNRLGIRSIKYDGRCVACHYTQQAQADRIVAVAGVSCESCHGAARDWLDVHHDYGDASTTRLTESAAQRRRRIAAAVERGMRNPHNLYLVAQSCYRCHTVPDEDLVNVGGHPAGSLDFEMVSWSQGSVRHKFLDSDGRINAASSPERLRVLFVVGLLADLEASLRAVAAATVKESYAITVAQRALRSAERLRSAADKLDHPLLEEALQHYAGVQLRLGRAEALGEVADAIAEIGYRFAEETDGEELAAIDPYIPPPEQWK